MSNCGRCHNCGSVLRVVLDGEEWCPQCETYRRYHSHGFARGACEYEECPQWLTLCPACDLDESGSDAGGECGSDRTACQFCGQNVIAVNLTAEEERA